MRSGRPSPLRFATVPRVQARSISTVSGRLVQPLAARASGIAALKSSPTVSQASTSSFQLTRRRVFTPAPTNTPELASRRTRVTSESGCWVSLGRVVPAPISAGRSGSSA